MRHAVCKPTFPQTLLSGRRPADKADTVKAGVHASMPVSSPVGVFCRPVWPGRGSASPPNTAIPRRARPSTPRARTATEGCLFSGAEIKGRRRGANAPLGIFAGRSLDRGVSDLHFSAFCNALALSMSLVIQRHSLLTERVAIRGSGRITSQTMSVSGTEYLVSRSALGTRVVPDAKPCHQTIFFPR